MQWNRSTINTFCITIAKQRKSCEQKIEIQMMIIEINHCIQTVQKNIWNWTFQNVSKFRKKRYYTKSSNETKPVRARAWLLTRSIHELAIGICTKIVSPNWNFDPTLQWKLGLVNCKTTANKHNMLPWGASRPATPGPSQARLCFHLVLP